MQLVLSETVDVDWKYGMSGKETAVCVSPGGNDYQSSNGVGYLYIIEMGGPLDRLARLIIHFNIRLNYQL